MAENELKHLSRKELLEMLITQSRELERLRKELDETQALLQDKTIRIREAAPGPNATFLFLISLPLPLYIGHRVTKKEFRRHIPQIPSAGSSVRLPFSPFAL